MKKYIIYFGILVLGVLLGTFLFKNSDTKQNEEHHHSEKIEKKQMWTCSMHPQIMKPEPGVCPICGMELIPVETTDNGLGANEIKLTKNAMALADVQTYVVGKDLFSEGQESGGIRLSGKLQKNEASEASQVSHFSGRIEKLNVNFVGEKVEKGQLLATIYSPELVAAQQELITIATLKDTQPELYQSVRNKLKLWKLSEKQINQIVSSGKIKDNFSVYADVSGTVSDMLVQNGDYVKKGQELFKIDNLNSLWAIFDVYENQIANISIGQSIDIITNAYPGKNFKGKISFIYPTLDKATRTVKVRANLSNNGKLKPGMFVEGRIKTDANTNISEIVTIPASAVLWTGKRSVVYVKTKPNQPVFEIRQVDLGSRMGNTFQILNGLKNGEEIVVNGAFTIDAAAQLQGKKSMMNQEVGQMDMSNVHKMNMHNKKSEKIKVSEEFRNQLEVVFQSYHQLKDMLAKDMSEHSQMIAKDIIKKLKPFEKIKIEDDKASQKWFALRTALGKYAANISVTADLTKQRENFKYLSENLIQAVELYGVNERVFIQYCPMANDNDGAYWLSTDEKIKNPYYGEKMLKCGETKKIID